MYLLFCNGFSVSSWIKLTLSKIRVHGLFAQKLVFSALLWFKKWKGFGSYL